MKLRNVMLGLLAAALMLPVFAMPVDAKETYIEINATNFPDSDFRTYITNLEKRHFSYNTSCNGDGKLSASEIKSITYISPTPYKDMESVKGIEYLTYLETAELWGCPKLKSIDVSNNKRLKKLRAYNSPITSVNLSGCTNLEYLDVRNTKISSLDITSCKKLSYLDISENSLLTQKVSIAYNDNLIYAWYQGGVSKTTKNGTKIEAYTSGDKFLKYNMLGTSYGVYAKIKKIDANNFPDANFRECIQKKDVNGDGVLSITECSTNDLYISEHNITSLKGIELFPNLKTLVARGNNISSIDLSQNTSLTYLALSKNNLTSIDLSKNTLLTSVYLDDNNISSVDVSVLSHLKTLNVSGNNSLAKVDVTKNTKLANLYASNCNLSSIDVTHNPELSNLYVGSNKLTYLNTSYNAKLTCLYCYSNKLTYLSLGSNPDLVYLWCPDNQLTSLDISKNTKLNSLVCDNNSIKRLDLHNCPNLKMLWCSSCKLTELDISKHSNLEDLKCNDNQISSLDLTNKRYLACVSADNNLLQTVDVSNDLALVTLHVNNNNISQITFANNEKLKYLGVADNKLTSLDISGLGLEYLNCSNNELTSLDLYNQYGIHSVICNGNKITELNLIRTVFANTNMEITEQNGVFYYFEEGCSSDIGCFTGTKPISEQKSTKYLIVDNQVKVTGSKTPAPTPATAPTGGSASGSTAGTTTPVNIDPALVDGFAERLYTKCLNRASDPNGKAYWISQLKAGVSGANVAKQFFYSPEFVGFGLNDQEYVTRLYRTFMDREPDQVGMDYWLSQLANGKSRDFVFYGFVNSPEWANICQDYGIVSGGSAKPTRDKKPTQATITFATRLYTTCLDRAAEDDGLTYWSTELANQRKSGTQVAYGFFFSAEFLSHFYNDEDYVLRLYRTFMGREPDDAGKAYWLGQLQSVDRMTVFYQFAGCQEFADICAEAGILR